MIHYFHLVAFASNNKNSGIAVICHEDITGKRGGEYHGNKHVPYYGRVLLLWRGNPSLLDYDDVITLHC